MKVLRITVALIALTTAAQAQYTNSNGLPPIEYDHPFKGKLVLETVTLDELRLRCRTVFPTTRACTFPGTGWCKIVMADDVHGWKSRMLMRHEVGHCNGWPGTHFGARVAPPETIKRTSEK